MLQVVQMEHPPLRLPLGEDVLQASRQKLVVQVERKL
jgi:hypothetical protein